MKNRRPTVTFTTIGVLTLAFCLPMVLAAAQESESGAASQVGDSTIDPDGTAHITRTIPVPETISPEAQKYLARPATGRRAASLAERRASTDEWRNETTEEARKLYPVKAIEEQTFGGVRTDVITPLAIPENKRNRVLINIHGGGFVVDAGSLVEGIPIANLTQTCVVSVYYRLAPENPFPAAVDDVVAVYKELLKTHEPRDIGIYGTSAGAVLTAEVAVELHRLGLPLPAALGIFSATGDLSRRGDSAAFFTLRGLAGEMPPPARGPRNTNYLGTHDPKNPVVSPVYADLTGFPPALLMTSTRDFLLSGTTILHRAYLRAGVKAELVVFEALPHAFWNEFDLPESREALALMAKFFDENLGR